MTGAVVRWNKARWPLNGMSNIRCEARVGSSLRRSPEGGADPERYSGVVTLLRLVPSGRIDKMRVGLGSK